MSGIAVVSCVLVAIGVLIAVEPMASVALVGGSFVLVLLFHFLKMWRAIFSLLVLSLLLASSPVGTWLPEAARFVLLATLFIVTLAMYPPRFYAASRDVKRLSILVIALILLSLVTSLWSAYSSVSLSRTIVLAFTIAIPLIAVHGRWREQHIIAGDIVLIFVIMSSISIIGLVVGTASGDIGRLSGLFANSNTYAWVCALSLALGVGVAALYEGWTARIVRGINLLLIVGLVLSLSRTSFVAGIAALGIGYICQPSQRHYYRVYGVLVLAVVGSWVLGVNSIPEEFDAPIRRFATETSATEVLAGREVGWSEAVQMWREKPLAGHGFGSTESLLSERRMRGEVFFHFDSFHNSWLQVLVEWGLLGAFLLLSLYAIAIGVWMREWRVGENSIWVASFAALVTGIVVQIGESVLFGLGSAFPLLFWCFVCATVGVRHTNEMATPKALASGSGH